MNGLYALLSQPLCERVGWALVHFLWQGAAVGLLLGIALLALRRRSPNARYVAGCVALFLMAAAPPLTMFLMSAPRRVTVPRVSVEHQPAVASPSAIAVPAPPVIVEPAPAYAAPTDPAPAAPPPAAAPWWERAHGWLEARLPWAVAGWLAGVVALSLRLVGGWALVRRMKRAGTGQSCKRLGQTLDRLRRALRLSRPVRLLESALARAPVAVGWLRPAILLPASALTGLSPAQLEAILAHELAHVRRHDYLVNLLQTVVETVLFYHPAVHWVSRRVRREREECCDELAVRVCGDRVAYARALAAMEGLRSARPQLTVAASGGNLLARIRRIVGLPDRDSVRGPRWLAGVFITLAVTTAGLIVYNSAANAQTQRWVADAGGRGAQDASVVLEKFSVTIRARLADAIMPQHIEISSDGTCVYRIEEGPKRGVTPQPSEALEAGSGGRAPVET